MLPRRSMRAVTGPVSSSVVRQIARSAVIWNVGSPGPRRHGDSVAPGLTGPANSTVVSAGVEVSVPTRPTLVGVDDVGARRSG
jgi:hypothetical protein